MSLNVELNVIDRPIQTPHVVLVTTYYTVQRFSLTSLSLSDLGTDYYFLGGVGQFPKNSSCTAKTTVKRGGGGGGNHVIMGKK